MHNPNRVASASTLDAKIDFKRKEKEEKQRVLRILACVYRRNPSHR
jgi:hypothetical protein